MIVSKNDILSLIPQRPPFVMIDQLMAHNETSTTTQLLIADSNVLVFDHEFSEAGLIENIAQTAAAGVGYSVKRDGGAVKTGYIGAIKNLEVLALPKTGDVIDTTVTIENQVFDVTIISGTVKRNDELLATCEMKIFIKN